MNENVVVGILREIERKNQAYDHNTFGVSEEEFHDAFRYLVMNKLADNVLFADDVAYEYALATVTAAGREFLKLHSN